MVKMTIMRGLPASGKSHKAKELLNAGKTVRLNNDLMRTMLHCDKFTVGNEAITQEAKRVLLNHFLGKGINVIVDDTNLNPNTVQRLIEIANDHDAKVEYCDLLDVTLDTCIYRDMARDKKVGQMVIKKMALQYLNLWKGERVIICDLDGTLCNIDHRLHFVTGEKKDWKGFFGGIAQDPIRNDVVEKIAKLLRDNIGARLLFVSGRSEDYREVTEEWLQKNFTYSHMGVIMRQSNDKRVDTEVKSEIYDKYLKNLNIIKVLDDRPSVIRMWRDKGLDVEDVGRGIEF